VNLAVELICRFSTHCEGVDELGVGLLLLALSAFST